MKRIKFYYWDDDCLIYNEIKKSFIVKNLSIIIGVIILIGTVLYGLGFRNGKKSEITENDVVLLYQNTENLDFSKRKFYEYLKEINIRFPELVFAQAIKESGFKSHLFKENHNPFGMKEATKRPNKQSGSQNGHAYYNTWKDAAIDYAMYQSYIGLSRLKTEDQYLNFIKEMGYYDTDNSDNDEYLNDLKKIRDNIDGYLK